MPDADIMRFVTGRHIVIFCRAEKNGLQFFALQSV